MTEAHANDEDLTAGWRVTESLGRLDFAVVTDKLDPGASTGRRRSGSEKVLMVVDGDARAHIGGESTELTAGSSLLIPACVPHEVENVGGATLRLITAVNDERAA
jgi:mannose-6-phosphate isomerase-like protein (cupin superfamily)